MWAFKEARAGKARRGATCCVRALQMQRALPWTGQVSVKSFCVKISRQTNMGTVVVGICYRLPAPETEVDKVFCKQVEEF